MTVGVLDLTLIANERVSPSLRVIVRVRTLELKSGQRLTNKGTMKRIVVLNPKGGSGKTTIAINLAGYFASRQQKPVLMDFDPQGSSVRWVKKRKPTQAPVHAIAAFEKDNRTTRAFQL